MRRARLVEASVCTEREGGGGGGTRGETGARKEGGKGACQLCRRRVTNRPTACYHPASLGILSLSFYLSISLSLSLSPLSSLSDHSRGSVFLASYHRTVPPASRRPINRVVSPPRYVVSTAKFVARPKLRRPPNRIDCFFPLT